jgi:hypothetical protein
MLLEKRFFAASPTIVSGDDSFAENEPNKTDRQGLPQQVKNNRAEPVGERPARILIRNRCKLPVWDFRKRRPNRTWDQVTFPLLIKTTINILIERGKSKGHAHPATLLADIGTIRANLVFVFSIFPPLTVLAPRDGFVSGSSAASFQGRASSCTGDVARITYPSNVTLTSDKCERWPTSRFQIPE